jgi:hypothetical protein
MRVLPMRTVPATFECQLEIPGRLGKLPYLLCAEVIE